MKKQLTIEQQTDRQNRLEDRRGANCNIKKFGHIIASHKKIAILRAMDSIVAGV